MKNTIVKYELEELDDFIVSDYFSKTIDIFTLKEQIGAMLDVYVIDDNDRLERISHELYGTPDYWDMLLMLNERDPLFDMPYDYDNLHESTKLYTDKYKFFIYSHAPLFAGLAATELTEYFMQLLADRNEASRNILIIKPSSIGDFVKLLSDNGYL